MVKSVVSRAQEIQELEKIQLSKKPEFVAIYGRRRIGKTYMVREYFNSKDVIFFNVTGLRNGTMQEQIKHFTTEIGSTFYRGATLKEGINWDETFSILTKAINECESKKPIVLFMDEFPWMATPNSRLLDSLDYYWNHHWSQNQKVKLIICGSSASWIINNIINNPDGLHNRITKEIHLEPFNLKQTKEYLKFLGIKLNNSQIINLYMATGGVAYYLSFAEKGKSSTQLIDQLAFQKKAPLFDEFNKLFASLFKGHELHESIIRHLAKCRYGLGQEELLKKLDPSVKGKRSLDALTALEEAGFIISFKPYQHQQKGIYYKVIDEYSLFYLHWIEPVKDTLLKRSLRQGYWELQQKSPGWHSWSGLAFEAICYKHINQIAKTLKLNQAAIPSTWRYKPRTKSPESGAQIDLLFDRQDDAITLGEIKYTEKPFAIDKAYASQLLKKMDIFKQKTKTKKQLFLVMISANGLKETMYSEEIINGLVTSNDLFQEGDE